MNFIFDISISSKHLLFTCFFKLVTDIQTLDDEVNIEIKISEDNEDILQAFTINANRKRIWRLKEVAAYNDAQYISQYISHVDCLQPPNFSKRQFGITY